MIRGFMLLRRLGISFLPTAVLMAAFSGLGAAPGIVRPYESSAEFAPASPIDGPALAAMRKRGVEPAYLCSDEVFVRRAYLDVIGTLPEPSEVRQFLQDSRPGKRAALIDALLQRDEFADYWTMKWCDLLRVKAEFPINLWPNAVQAYYRWIYDAIRDNRPYDQFARELLTSSGSNFRVGPVNFYRAVQGRKPADLAAATALTFMGTRFDGWPEERRAGMAAFFSRIAYKPTGEWKEEIVCLDPASSTTLEARFPDAKNAVRIAPDKDPRQVFADWLITPNNPWFTRAVANRVWYWLMGRGVIHEPDDLRPDNPPSSPELLAVLETELVKSKYDLKHLFRLVLTSRTYQQSSIPRSDRPEAGTLFACYPVRRLDAEVLIDALDWIGGSGENYSSPIPEPFTFIPENQRTIALADGSITSPFLETFGRPPRDTGLESERNNQSSDAQRLYLLNSTEVQRKIEGSRRLANLVASAAGNRRNLIGGIYMTVLSRYPTPDEEAAAGRYFPSYGQSGKQASRQGGKQSNRQNSKQSGAKGYQQAVADLAWALINSKEFLYRH